MKHQFVFALNRILKPIINLMLFLSLFFMNPSIIGAKNLPEDMKRDSKTTAVDVCAPCNRGITPLLIQAKDDAERARRLELSQALLGALKEMEINRNIFLKDGKFINLFEVVYFHTTKNEMSNILALKYKNPSWKMQHMLNFYYAYRYNRQAYDKGDTNKIEPEWGKFFDRAENADGDLITGPFDIEETLNLAINAHVAHDLARSIQYTYQQNSSEKQDIFSDFKASNSLFDITVANTSADIAEASYSVPNWLLAFGEFWYKNAQRVKDMREAAWQQAMTSKYNPKLPQPKLSDAELGRMKALYTQDCDGSIPLVETVPLKVYKDGHYGISEISLCGGDSVDITVQGVVQLGGFAGRGEPTGIAGFTRYNLCSGFPHGSVLGVVIVGDAITCKNVVYIGPHKSLSVSVPKNKVGKVFLVVNDNDWQNNRGEFIATVTIRSKQAGLPK